MEKKIIKNWLAIRGCTDIKYVDGQIEPKEHNRNSANITAISYINAKGIRVIHSLCHLTNNILNTKAIES